MKKPVPQRLVPLTVSISLFQQGMFMKPPNIGPLDLALASKCLLGLKL